MTARDDIVVSASDVTIEYAGGRGRLRHRAIDGVTFDIARGELLGLVGETGSGKSTLARTIAGYTARGLGSKGAARMGIPIDDMADIVGGSLDVLGVKLRSMRMRDRYRITFDVGYLPQGAGRMLMPGYTIAENVGEPLLARDRHFDRRELGVRVAELIDAVQLPLGVMDRYPHELSSGQRQRVAIARSLILEPLLWVADEPTAGVDVTVRGPVLDTILEVQSEHEFSALIISHDAAVTARLTDRVAVLQGGGLVGLGRLEEVLTRPIHPYVRGLAVEYELTTGPITLPDLPLATGAVPLPAVAEAEPSPDHTAAASEQAQAGDTGPASGSRKDGAQQ